MDKLHAVLQRNESFLSTHIQALPTTSSKLKEAMEYSVLNGGKRVRPFLIYSVGEMLGADASDLDRAAAAIECIHAFSLIHDDLPAMDDDALRRGKPTCHIAFGEATAILAGDALQTEAFALLADNTKSTLPAEQVVKMVQTLAQASGYRGMCGGQALDVEATNIEEKLSLEALEQIHKNKTGALIVAAVQLGALCAPKVSQQDFLALTQWAEFIGHAYQVHDDILDITGDTEALGKVQGADLNLEKSTYPSLLGLEQAIATRDALVEKALQALSTIAYNTELLQEFTQYLINRDR
ncbi:MULTISPECIES: (2E,6E)-farnesyl diphosphate synthase [Gammaproteobacteria]|uniref:(2E,6E)-farnesyl diphosphate synthase n=2 Tax=Gammaproteobacteria TaxID=1236 RepID=UPI001A9CF099|nr:MULTISPECIES: (2E,6E)-farnesyl diphosphate synthase [Gammaproteobacteria]